MNWTLEVAVIPVTDVDRAKAFYSDKLGFNVDVDNKMGDSFRNVQTTPPGSGCSVTFGTGLTPGLQLCVQDITAAHEELSSRGVDVDAGPAHRRERLAGRTGWPVELVLLLQGPGRQQLGRPGEARGLAGRAGSRRRLRSDEREPAITHARSELSDRMAAGSTST